MIHQVRARGEVFVNLEAEVREDEAAELFLMEEASKLGSAPTGKKPSPERTTHEERRDAWIARRRLLAKKLRAVARDPAMTMMSEEDSGELRSWMDEAGSGLLATQARWAKLERMPTSQASPTGSDPSDGEMVSLADEIEEFGRGLLAQADGLGRGEEERLRMCEESLVDQSWRK